LLGSPSKGIITPLICEITLRQSQCTWLQSTNFTDRRADTAFSRQYRATHTRVWRGKTDIYI